jgi:hypothetical protein
MLAECRQVISKGVSVLVFITHNLFTRRGKSTASYYTNVFRQGLEKERELGTCTINNSSPYR